MPAGAATATIGAQSLSTEAPLDRAKRLCFSSGGHAFSVENGLEPIGEAPRSGADNTKIAFFHPKDTGGVLLEIVEVQ